MVSSGGERRATPVTRLLWPTKLKVAQTTGMTWECSGSVLFPVPLTTASIPRRQHPEQEEALFGDILVRSHVPLDHRPWEQCARSKHTVDRDASAVVASDARGQRVGTRFEVEAPHPRWERSGAPATGFSQHIRSLVWSLLGTGSQMPRVVVMAMGRWGDRIAAYSANCILTGQACVNNKNKMYQRPGQSLCTFMPHTEHRPPRVICHPLRSISGWLDL